jgi:ABC-type transport system involved in multi-copper enzyme maturation permease subunit
MARGGNGSFYAGTVLLMTVLIGLGIELAFVKVVNERKEQTLAFVMSLPISARDYTVAKILANLLIFLIPFLALGTVTVGLFSISTTVAGLVPFSAVVLGELFASYCFLLAVALISESEGWTVGAMVAANLFLQGFLYYVSHIPSIGKAMSGGRIVWSSAAVSLLLAELVVVVVLLTVTLVLQNRKSDFI